MQSEATAGERGLWERAGLSGAGGKGLRKGRIKDGFAPNADISSEGWTTLAPAAIFKTPPTPGLLALQGENSQRRKVIR